MHRAEKRKRYQHACDECRRKKIRCDSETKPDNFCTPCLNLHLHCTHTKSPQRRGPRRGSTNKLSSSNDLNDTINPKPGTGSSTLSIQTLVESILEFSSSTNPNSNPNNTSPTIPIPSSSSSTSRTYLLALATHIRSLESQLEAALARETRLTFALRDLEKLSGSDPVFDSFTPKNRHLQGVNHLDSDGTNALELMESPGMVDDDDNGDDGDGIVDDVFNLGICLRDLGDLEEFQGLKNELGEVSPGLSSDEGRGRKDEELSGFGPGVWMMKDEDWEEEDLSLSGGMDYRSEDGFKRNGWGSHGHGYEGTWMKAKREGDEITNAGNKNKPTQTTKLKSKLQRTTTQYFGESSNLMLALTAMSHHPRYTRRHRQAFGAGTASAHAGRQSFNKSSDEEEETTMEPGLRPAQAFRTSLSEWKHLFFSVRRPRFWDEKDEDTRGCFEFGKSSSASLFPTYTFPSPTHLRSLIITYFTQYNVYLPLLHRPTFERAVFEEELHLRDKTFGALVLVVCAIATCGSGGQGVEEEEDEDDVERRTRQGEREREQEREREGRRKGLGWEWLQQIPIERFVFGQPISLHLMQMLCLYTYHLQGICPHSDTAWVLSGIAIRLAQAAGLHRRKSSSSCRGFKAGSSPGTDAKTNGLNGPGPGSSHTIESELWKRVFWVLIFMDTFISSWFGRPRAISWHDFDIEPLIECDDEYWPGEPATLSTSVLPRAQDGFKSADSSQKAFVQPPGKPSLISFWTCTTRMLRIIAYMQKTIYAVRKSDIRQKHPISAMDYHKQAVTDLDSALNQWLDSVPQHLQWSTTSSSSPSSSSSSSSSQIFFNQSTLLYTLYYWVQIQVHRRFIPRPSTGPVSSSCELYPCLTICTNAARSCLRVVETSCKRNFGGLFATAHFPFSLFNAALILIINLWKGIQNIDSEPVPKVKLRPKADVVDVHKEMADIYKCVDLMRLCEASYPISGRLIDVLNTLIAATNYLPPSPSGPGVIRVSSPSPFVSPTTTMSASGLGLSMDSAPGTKSFPARVDIDIDMEINYQHDPRTQAHFRDSSSSPVYLHHPRPQVPSTVVVPKVAGLASASLPPVDDSLSGFEQSGFEFELRRQFEPRLDHLYQHQRHEFNHQQLLSTPSSLSASFDDCHPGIPLAAAAAEQNTMIVGVGTESSLGMRLYDPYRYHNYDITHEASSQISDVNIPSGTWATDSSTWDSFMASVDQMLYTGPY
ncbi:hypothetical protein K435DRAFT_844343 [Dendrothele bispora CBS 962.96]|uniref:Zn(2)-C6 fungal-type domain-containing protein n=1 Tax=Dendrothele bispora (strain CBS 962.96) TaxID=1314807 RepID=A0A4V4HCC0_DENBC|nr:hypothetical protein K435DRAFT_844343 [Dendrothele bispora CBS 962.96]